MGKQREQLVDQITAALYDVERTVYLALDQDAPPTKAAVMDYLDIVAADFADILYGVPVREDPTSDVDLASELKEAYDEYVPDPWGVWSE